VLYRDNSYVMTTISQVDGKYIALIVVVECTLFLQTWKLEEKHPPDLITGKKER
jgi:hypothetical protein